MADRPLPSGPLERDPHALFRWVLDGVLVLGHRGAEPMHITAPGDAVWNAYAEPRTVEAVAAELSGRFAAPIDVVRVDIEPLVDALLSAGALRVAVLERSDDNR